MEKVVVGMSGGVDSFVTAMILQRQGYEVTGVTLELWGESRTGEVEALCRQLGIKLISWDGRELFRRLVVEAFVEGYASGQTPSPCCICNRCVKWTLLAQAADSLAIHKIATGHYVRIVETENGYYIRKGVDNTKDQSYFLWSVPQDILSRAVTPLGAMTKTEVKEYAVTNGYGEIVKKPESMGICFLRGEDYRDFISYRTKDLSKVQPPGDIVDVRGNVVGKHSGILNYTIGQKRGMPLWDGRPLYVAEIDIVKNRIVAGSWESLYKMTFEVEQVETVRREDLFAGEVEIKIRGLGLNPAGYISVTKKTEHCLKVELSSPAWAVAPGQPVAFYRGDLLLGGGIVKK